jgi:uncharacterized protein (TIGR03067 family)
LALVGNGPVRPDLRTQDDVALLHRGSWRVVRMEANGQKQAAPANVWTFSPGRVDINVVDGAGTVVYGVALDPKPRPLHIDLKDKDRDTVFRPGIWRVQGDTLQFCYWTNRPRPTRPSGFEPLPGTNTIMYTFERVRH